MAGSRFSASPGGSRSTFATSTDSSSDPRSDPASHKKRWPVRAVREGACDVRKAEKETVIRWDSEQKIATIDSYHPAVWRRLERAGYEPTLRRQLDGREVGRRYT